MKVISGFRGASFRSHNSQQTPVEHNLLPQYSIAAHRWGVAVLFSALIAYFIASLLLNRIYIFNDDILRLQMADYSPKGLLKLHPWGARVWLPFPTLVQGIAAKILPFALVPNVLLLNLILVAFCALMVQSLAIRVCPGIQSLLAPLLFVVSPSLAWLATSALSEPLFIFLLLGQALFLVRSIERMGNGSGQFGIAATFAFLAMLTRYEAWFVCPPVLILSSIYTWHQSGRKKWTTILFAGLALIAPVSWMLGSTFRYGNPVATLSRLSQIHNLHNANDSVVSLLIRASKDSLTVSVLGWGLLLAGFVVFVRMLLSQPRAPCLRPVIITLFLFTPLFILFVFSILTRNLGYPLPRFITVFYSLGTVVSVLPFRNTSHSNFWKLLVRFALLSIILFFALDKTRFPVYESVGARALDTIESLARSKPSNTKVAILFPLGEAEIAVNSVYIHAPSVASQWVHPQPGNFKDALSSLSQDFVLFQHKYWPDMKPDKAWKIMHIDTFYVLLARRDESPPE